MGIFDFFSGASRRPGPPDPLLTQNNSYFSNLDFSQPLQNYEMVVFDTELTGFNRKRDEIVSVGAVRLRSLRICCDEIFDFLVKPEDRMYTESTVVHQITPEDLAKARGLEEILPEFLEFSRQAVFVGHYIRMDLEFVNRAARRLLGGAFAVPYLDTMRLAMAYNERVHGHYYDHYNQSTSYNLQGLCKEYRLPAFSAHNAISDALQTAYLFIFLVKKLQGFDLRSLDDFLKAGRKWKIIP